ncbi:hypothetical protein EON65_21635 [archaeon]|nr:MAG: hypothetical protein EON65_21635 [archaeon]
MDASKQKIFITNTNLYAFTPCLTTSQQERNNIYAEYKAVSPPSQHKKRYKYFGQRDRGKAKRAA